MPTLLKDRFFAPPFLQRLAEAIAREYPAFDATTFFSRVHDDQWQNRELMDRMHHVATVLGETLPSDYSEALEILGRVAPVFSGFEGVLLSDFVAIHGTKEWERSMSALEIFTQYGSAEFAVRGFIEQNPDAALERLKSWAQHPNEHVRRLASEGSRPKLPWGKALQQFRRDPLPLIDILELLKEDDSDYVRRSVANNLNDISKDHPELALEIGSRWLGDSPRTDWIVKHALRTLLKRGEDRAMRLFGFEGVTGVGITNLEISPRRLQIGEVLEFSFDLIVEADGERRIRLEYAIDFNKSSGKPSAKVFQISERSYSPGTVRISRRHSMIKRSTRTLYPGLHRLTVIANGIRMESEQFELLDAPPGD